MRKSKRIDKLSFLIGKLDGLRFPILAMNYKGTKVLIYDEDYIQEVVNLRAEYIDVVNQLQLDKK